MDNHAINQIKYFNRLTALIYIYIYMLFPPLLIVYSRLTGNGERETGSDAQQSSGFEPMVRCQVAIEPICGMRLDH